MSDLPTEDELRAELEKEGPEAFRLKYGRLEHAPWNNRSVNTIKAILADDDREKDEAHRLAEADRGAKAVGLADEANRIAKRAVLVSIAAALIALWALIRTF